MPDCENTEMTAPRKGLFSGVDMSALNSDEDSSARLTIDLHLGDGTSRQTTVFPAVGDLLLLYARLCCILLDGSGGSNPEANNLCIAIRQADRELVSRLPSLERQAAFRLGQMDMQQSIRQMLLDTGDEFGPGSAQRLLFTVANMLDSMLIDDGGSI